VNRSDNLKRVQERQKLWDIIVIGGGATGAGCALDAASRGFSVLLLEQDDFGKGTSSRSTKLIHGGVRYLRQGNIPLVREALRERGILFRNAPHVVHKMAFVIPCYRRWDKFIFGVGLKLYDLLAGKFSFGRSRILSREETLRRLPSIKDDGLVGGILYYDGQFDDTRLLIDILRTACEKGATVLNYAKVTALTKDTGGLIGGVEFEDVEGGGSYSAAARCVINAAGAFCEPVRRMSDEKAAPILTYAQGIHLVFDRTFLPSDDALMIPKTIDGRVLFCIPWNGHLLAGTTDTPVENASLEPHALDAEIEFVLDTAGEYLNQKPTRDDILSIFAGIRPLIKGGAGERTASLSRGHGLFVDSSGLITITGGKWTTYRRMAEDTIDKAIEASGLEQVACVTRDLTISVPNEIAEPGELLHPRLPYTRGAVIRAVRDEMARTVEDVLARRTRALFLDAKAAIEIAPKVAEIIAEELGRDDEWKNRQLVDFNLLARGYTLL
jgi:glycerol-3-phosphate dehydrogenase